LCFLHEERILSKTIRGKLAFLLANTTDNAYLLIQNQIAIAHHNMDMQEIDVMFQFAVQTVTQELAFFPMFVIVLELDIQALYAISLLVRILA